MVGVSYDRPSELASFARSKGITFPLLSDEGSQTIDAYRLRNLEARGRTEGIPHPGTVIVDREGVIRAKLFHGGYKVRHGTDDILAAVAALDTPSTDSPRTSE